MEPQTLVLIASTADMGRDLSAHLNQGRYGSAQILSPEGIAALHAGAVDASAGGVTMTGLAPAAAAPHLPCVRSWAR